MSIYDDPRAVDQMAEAAAVEEAGRRASFKARADLVATAIAMVEDRPTQIALATLFTFFAEEMQS